jgi:hypothetical protein
MTSTTQLLLERVRSWPQEDQEELAEAALEIEARRSGVYRLGDEERNAVERGIADARAGRFASDAEVDALLQKARAARR